MTPNSSETAVIRASGTGSPKPQRALASNRKETASEALPVSNAPDGSVRPVGAAGRFGAVKGQKPHRGNQVTVAQFRAMWFDSTLTLADIALKLNVCTRSVWQRARHRGMPDRNSIIAPGPAPKLDATAEAMWRACVCAEDIAAAYGVTGSAVHQHMHRNAVKRGRKVNRWHKAISLDDYRATALRLAMQASARETEAAIDLSEMRDRKRTGGNGRKAA